MNHMRYFSPKTLGFYLKAVHGAEIPADARPISEELFNELVRDRKAEHTLGVSADGMPVLMQAEVPSQEEALRRTHATQTYQVDKTCEQAITAGFQSAALGAPHHYSSQLDDQLNLTGAILRGLDMPYACRDEQGVKAFRMHTSAQLRQVGDDFTLYKLQLLQHANELKQQLDLALEAGDAEAMALIRWEAVQP